MKIELICLGTELLVDKINTNIKLIGEKLANIGLILTRAITVGDEIKEIIQSFTYAISRSDIVIATGGLGPTFDDLTREAVAQVSNRKLIFNRDAMQSIAAHFVKRNREMPKENERQAYILDGAKVIINKVGTAPGQILEFKQSGFDKTVILLPGPPNELSPMLNDQIIPYFRTKYKHAFRKTTVLHIYGKPESLVDEKIQPVVEMERKIESQMLSFAILAHRGIIDVKFTVTGSNEILVDELVKNVKNEMYEILGDDVYGENEQTLESVVGGLLMKKKKTISVAESCTGGLLSNKITNIPGSSLYYKGSIISYDNEIKTKLLNVDFGTIKTNGAVSKETVLEMARGVQEKFGTNCAISISGITGPGGGSTQKPVGTVCIGMIVDDKEYVDELKFMGMRLDLKERFSNEALELLRRRLK